MEMVMSGRAVPYLEDALRMFEIHDGQSGVLLFLGDELAEVFVVSHPDDYRALHRSLITDSFSETLLLSSAHSGPSPALPATIDARAVDSLAALREEVRRFRARVGSTHVDKGIEVEYRVTARDCEDIADHVSDLVSADMRSKLEGKKMNDKQREAAERDAADAAEKERAAWLKQCQSLVGEVQQRSRIDCAIAAASVKAVDDCLNQ